MATMIGESFSKELKERRAEVGTMPELPQAFYPPYREPPALPLAGLGDVQLISSSRGPGNYTRDGVAIGRKGSPGRRSQRDAAPVGIGRLEGRGNLQRRRPKFVAPANGPWRSRYLLAYWPAGEAPLIGSSPREPALYIHYVNRMTQEEMRAAIDTALADNASANVLIRLENWCSEDQRRRMLKVLESHHGQTPETSLALANLYYRRLGLSDKAWNEFLRACALLCTMENPAGMEKRVRNLAKDLGDEKLVEQANRSPDSRRTRFHRAETGPDPRSAGDRPRRARPLLCQRRGRSTEDALAKGSQERSGTG